MAKESIASGSTRVEAMSAEAVVKKEYRLRYFEDVTKGLEYVQKVLQ